VVRPIEYLVDGADHLDLPLEKGHEHLIDHDRPKVAVPDAAVVHSLCTSTSQEPQRLLFLRSR